MGTRAHAKATQITNSPEFERAGAFLKRVARNTGCQVEYEEFATHSVDKTALVLCNESDGQCLFEATVAGVVTSSEFVEGVHARSRYGPETGLETVANGSQMEDTPEFVGTLTDQNQASNLSESVTTSRVGHQKKDHNNTVN